MDATNKTKEELLSEIQELKQKEEKNRTNLKHWQMAFNAIDDFVLLLSPNLDIIEMNLACLLHFKKERSDLIGKKCYEIIHQTNAPIPECPCLQVLQKKQTLKSEYVKGGKTMELSAWPVFGNSGEIISLTHIMKDISKQKNDEQQINQQYQELQRLNATKDKFFSIIAHDLRSPLLTISGLTELLIDKKTDLNNFEKLNKYIEYIHDSANNALNLADNLLNWAMMQKGKMEVFPERIDLTDLINEKIEKYKPNAIKKKITIDQSIHSHYFVYADSNMLKTVLRNLLSNAIKFTNENGAIQINLAKHENLVEISVADNGIGISEENMSKLFCIDESLKTRGTADESGTGLGLIITKEFVVNNGGKIWVESKLGNGCAFKFTLPLCETEEN